MSDIFISYSREDKAQVNELANEFKRLGWSVWIDKNIGASAEFDEVIERELYSASCVVVVWSRSSVSSQWVRAEASAADEQGKLIPVSFEQDVLPPLRFRQLNVVKLDSASLSNPAEEEQALLAEITSLTGKKPEGTDLLLTIDNQRGNRSGARIVTSGKWQLTARVFLAEAQYNLELYSNGMVTGKGSWFISRAQFSGRWYFDKVRNVLQLQMSGGVSKGMESMIIEINRWEDDYTAQCTFIGRKAQLKRLLD